MNDLHIALLRGINLGGRNRLPMRRLVDIFSAVGCRDVATYIQSGNVVFRADEELAARVPVVVSEAISDDPGLEVPVVTRTAAELERVAGNNPFLEEGTDVKALHVGFLMDPPAPADVEALDPDRSSPDKFAVRGREIYLRCPNGVARTKLTTRYFDARLRTTTTLRNWRTVQKLLELVRTA